LTDVLAVAAVGDDDDYYFIGTASSDSVIIAFALVSLAIAAAESVVYLINVHVNVLVN